MNDHREEGLFEHCLGLPPEGREDFVGREYVEDEELNLFQLGWENLLEVS